MKESNESEEELSKGLIEDDMDDDEDFKKDVDFDKNNNNDNSCLTKCCLFSWLCCCCQNKEKGKKFYQKEWRSFLVKEGNDTSDEPFVISTNLFTNKDGSIQALESIRLNPNLVSANKLRNDLEFYIPQLCTFLLFGEMKAIEEFFVFLCKVCNASFFFAHRVHWFLSAMINASQEKKDDIIGILKMVNTLFKSENQKRKAKLNNFYIANSSPFIKFIKSHNLYFLYNNKCLQEQTNIFDEVDYNNLDGYQQEIYNKYKKSRDTIIKFSEDEFKEVTEKDKNKNEEIIDTKDKKNKDKFKSNDFFIDISNFKLLNNDVTYEEDEDDQIIDKDIYGDKININEEDKINKNILDINFVSYHSTLNFIDHLCDISNELPKHPIEEQMSFLYQSLLEINKKLPCNVYLPFLEDSTRNYLICHIPLDGVKIFRTKTRCPIMLTFELIRIDEINKGIKKEEEYGETINIGRSRSIASINSSMNLENPRKKQLLKDKIVSGPKKNNYRNADYDLSKPVLLQKIGVSNPSRHTTNVLNPISEKKPNSKTEMTEIVTKEKKDSKEKIKEDAKEDEEDIDTRMDKYQAKHRKSVMSISSTDSLNEDDINEKFKKIVTKIRNNPSNPKRENNTIKIESNLEKEKAKEKEIIPLQSSKTVVSGEKKILLNEEDTDKIDELVNQEMKKPEVKNKNVNVEAIKKVFEKSFRQKAKDIKKNSLFGNLDSHKIFRCIFKTHEDLRQEQFATQLINEFYQIFKLENTGCWLNTYEIISTGNDAGLVEMVNDSVSLDQLKQKIQQASLHDFYLYSFGNGDPNSLRYKKAMNNFVASLAGYSLVCYFLQIKDRHNGNILIDNKGHLIHIDFGFLLSNSPGKGIKFETAPFKLSKDMIDAMGGYKSKYFDDFKKLMKKGFQAINKHRHKISILVEMMWCGHGKNLDCFEGGQDAINQLKMRLNPKDGITKKEMDRIVDDLINQSAENWRTKFYDIFQYHSNGIFY
jgi:phosphatidylinositol 4-kinase